jgi:hypothetical protein
VGNVNVGSTGPTVVSVTNTGTTSAALPLVAIVGTDATQFAILPPGGGGGGTCNPGLQTLAVGAPGCNLQLAFTPSSAGSKTATLNLGTSTPPAATTGVTGGS